VHSILGEILRVQAMATQQFQIDVQQSVLADLKERLLRTRWADSFDGAGWNYGTDPHLPQQL